MAHKNQNDGALIWGVVAIGLGVVFLLQTLFDIAIFRELWKFWPVVLIIWGIIAIKNSRS